MTSSMDESSVYIHITHISILTFYYHYHHHLTIISSSYQGFIHSLFITIIIITIIILRSSVPTSVLILF